jgi:hypothetical protein
MEHWYSVGTLAQADEDEVSSGVPTELAIIQAQRHRFASIHSKCSRRDRVFLIALRRFKEA